VPLFGKKLPLDVDLGGCIPTPQVEIVDLGGHPRGGSYPASPPLVEWLAALTSTTWGVLVDGWWQTDMSSASGPVCE
jgi:hypothetical protein